MPRCLLHIGTYKTGTSAIQMWLWRNRKALAGQGVQISEALRPGHGRLHRYALEDADIAPSRRDVGETTPAAVAAWREAVDAELDRLAATARGGLVILSDEALGDMTRASDIARLRDSLAMRFDQVQVVVYLRPQHEREASGFSQRLRHGDAPDRVAPSTESWNLERLDYARLLARWADEFGAQCLTPRICQPGALVNGDSVADFAFIAGIDPTHLESVGRRNEGLTPRGQRLLRWLNLRTPRYLADGRFNAARAAMLVGVNRVFQGAGLQPARAEAEAFYRRFADSNEAVRRRWFPDRESLFDLEFNRYPEAEQSLDATAEEIAGSLADLVAELGGVMHLRAERTAELRERIASQRSRMDQMRERIDRQQDRIATLERQLDRKSA